MKKKVFFFSVIAMLFVAVGLRAQSLTHENYISRSFDYANVWDGWDVGEPPTADCAEDEYFYISRVRPLKRFTNANSQVNTSLNVNRGLLWFCPISGDGWTSLPRYMFNSEAYNMWQYTDIHGNWTQGIHGCPGAMTDAAHKNGCAVVITSQPAFAANLNSDGNGAVYTKWINGGATKFLKHLAYYGYDGIGFNSECSFVGYTGLQGLWGQMHNQKANYGKDLLCFPWYDGVLESGTGPSFSEQLNSSNDGWFWNAAAGNYASKAHFINYNWDTQRGLQTSQSTAESLKSGSSWHVYAGQDWQGATHDAQWTYLAEYNISIGVWGAHNKNMIYEGAFGKGSSGPVVQTEYLNTCERVFTGTTKNPVNTPALANNRAVPKDPWAGISKLVVARSTLSWVANDYFPFVTRFNLGNGESFRSEGKVTFDSEWYNLGMQDFLPTWRWWISNTFMGRDASSVPENFKASLTYEDAWFGGSCLKIENTDAANTSVYLQLFKTQFPITTGYEFTIRYKVLSGSATLQWAGSKEGSESTAVTRPIGAVSVANASEWTEKSVTTSAWTAFNGSTLAVLGLRFVNPSADFKMLIGEMSVKKAGEVFNPVKPTINTTYSGIKRASYLGIDLKLVWDCEVGGGSSTPDPDPTPAETIAPLLTTYCSSMGTPSD
ncbi:MAG: secretion protein Por, partial [Paludibacteraceae bacterium]|nr:secretion protein Por [Paludibacteraceae bacterium]